MQSSFIFVLVAIAVATSYAHIEDVNSTHENQDTFLKLLSEKCKENGGNENAYNELVQTLEDTYRNFSYVSSSDLSSSSPAYDYTEICKHIENEDLYHHVEILADKLTPCLTSDEAYFPKFLLTAYNASIEESCGPNGLERTQAFVNDIKSSSCFQSAEGSFRRPLELIECYPNLKMYQNFKNNDISVKKEDLCSDLRSMKKCIIDVLKEKCKDDHSETVSFMLDPFVAGCDD